MDRDEEGEPIYNPEEDAGEEEWQQPVQDEWPDDEPQKIDEAASPSASDAEEKSSSKPRKRLVKKSAVEESQRQKYREKTRSSAAERSRLFKSGGKEQEREMWNTVAGDSEDDNEGQRTNEDRHFIDDEGVEPAAHYVGSDDDAASAGDAPQAEEGEEEEDDLKRIFKSGKKRKNVEPTDQEIAAFVENFMGRLEAAAEDDADLNRRSKPAINKLMLLPSLVSVLQKRQYQNEFLDRGVLTLLKNWLEPLPDASLPNMNIRSAILNLLTELPIDLEQEDRREQLKKSGLGKVIMFLSKLEEETPANKKIAKDLVDKWSRPLFQKSTRYESLRGDEDERERPAVRKPPSKKLMRNSLEDDLMEDEQQATKDGKAAYRTTRPQAVAMDFVVRPQSKRSMEEFMNKKPAKDQTKRQKMQKKLQQRAPRRKLQAERISVEGRGLTRL